ncbi:Hypothetical protein NTJ_01819 [Nesidiocoris tenuis]|uniref:MARVEL domain-containing protein n=1 Tax=Nesidiocoris tenuis TaxID=355587 RepID=A0ABN7ADR8_9HEMI|nr:Hypothetical protein NTJ_01819 [Nesidiocoris tenuis]
MSVYRKESVISEVGRTADELPSIIARLTTSTVVWTHPETLYPFSRVLRLRVLQIVCGISILVMGAVGAIEERGDPTNLALGVPAGVLTVLAAGISIHLSRGFGGYRVSKWSDGSVLRAIGPTPQTAAPLFLVWTAAITFHVALFVQSTITLYVAAVEGGADTKFQLAIVELALSGLTLGAVLEVTRINIQYDQDSPTPMFAGQTQQRSSSSEKTQTVQLGTSCAEVD